MKIKSFVTGLAAACLLLPSCSSDNEPVENPSINADTDGLVEIKLSSRANATRAAVNNDENGNFTLENIGIFGVATDVQNPDNHAVTSIDWTKEDATDLLLNNVAVNATPNAEATGTDLNWVDGNIRYYPAANWYKYGFYGYYPLQLDDSVTVSANAITVNMDIDGTQDVLWGSAVSDEPYAYSAKYARQNANDATKLPNIEFKHMLTRFTFGVDPGEVNGSTAAATTVTVKSIRLIEQPYKLTLNVAQNDQTQVLTADENAFKDFYLCGETKADTASLQVPATVSEDGKGTPIGESIMTVPGKRHYKIKVVLLDQYGNELPTVENYIHLGTDADGWEPLAGTSYNVRMIVYGPQEIVMKATLEDWHYDEVPGSPIELN